MISHNLTGLEGYRLFNDGAVFFQAYLTVLIESVETQQHINTDRRARE